MRSLRGAFIACVIIAASAVALAQAPDKRLTIADVEKVSGLSGMKQVARDSQTGAGGDLNFVDANGQLVLMVRFATATLYDSVRKGSTFNAVVPGLGDDAFTAPPGATPYVLYVKKGTQAISLTSFPGKQAPYAPRLTLDQLKALAMIVLSRL